MEHYPSNLDGVAETNGMESQLWLPVQNIAQQLWTHITKIIQQSGLILREQSSQIVGGISGTTVALLATVLLGHNNPEDMLIDSIDMVEINHCLTEEGNPRFDQVIYYRWSNERRRYDIVDSKGMNSPNMRPILIGKLGASVAVWHDSTENNVLRMVRTKMVVEKWTLYDPEMYERKYLPKDRRQELLSMVDWRTRRHRQGQEEMRIVENETSQDHREIPLFPAMPPADVDFVPPDTEKPATTRKLIFPNFENNDPRQEAPTADPKVNPFLPRGKNNRHRMVVPQ